MSTVESILSASGQVADIVEPLDPETAEQERLEAVAAVQDAQARVDLYVQAREKINTKIKNLKRDEAQLLYAIGCEIADLGGEESTSIERSVETLGTARLKLSINGAALAVTGEQKLPRAQAELLHRQADLKFAAADKIDADRWSRLRAHSEALESLVASEGDTEIKPARFEEEGKVGEELRLEGVRLRQQAMEAEQQLKARKA